MAAVKAIREVHEKSHEMMQIFGEDNPMNWIDIDENLRDSQTWNNASTDNLENREFKVVKQKSKKTLKKRKTSTSKRDLQKTTRSGTVSSSSPNRYHSPSEEPSEAYESKIKGPFRSSVGVFEPKSLLTAGASRLMKGNIDLRGS